MNKEIDNITGVSMYTYTCKGWKFCLGVDDIVLPDLPKEFNSNTESIANVAVKVIDKYFDVVDPSSQVGGQKSSVSQYHINESIHFHLKISKNVDIHNQKSMREFGKIYYDLSTSIDEAVVNEVKRLNEIEGCRAMYL